MLTFDGVWHFGEVFSSRMNPGFHCTGQMADSVYGIVWVSGLLMSMLWIKWIESYNKNKNKNKKYEFSSSLRLLDPRVYHLYLNTIKTDFAGQIVD